MLSECRPHRPESRREVSLHPSLSIKKPWFFSASLRLPKTSLDQRGGSQGHITRPGDMRGVVVVA